MEERAAENERVGPGAAEAAAAGAAVPAAVEPPAPAAPESPAPATGGGAWLRLVVAVVPIPWLVGYGIFGVWAVTRGATSASRGLTTIDVGYTRMVSPGSVMAVGGLLVAGFAVTLAVCVLLLVGGRGVSRWLPPAVVAGLLTAGAVWAGVRGELHPGLWLLFFFGLAYGFVVAVVQVWRTARRPGATRAPARERGRS